MSCSLMEGLVSGLSAQKIGGQGGSSSSLNRSLDSRTLKSPSLSTLDSDSHGSDPDVSGRLKFDQVLFTYNYIFIMNVKWSQLGQEEVQEVQSITTDNKKDHSQK